MEYVMSLGWCSQERIDHGVLTQWTKGFGASGVEGEDAAALFRKSLKKFVSRIHRWVGVDNRAVY